MKRPTVPSAGGGETGPAAGPPPHPGALAGAAVGVLTAAVAMGVGQLAAGLTVAQSSPVLAVGQAAIDLTPLPVKDFAISTFGADDKTALLVGILVILGAFAAVIGILAVRRLALGLAGLAVFACIGLAAALTRPTATPAYAIPTLVGAAAGAFALTRLVRAARGLRSRPSRSAGARTAASELKPPDLPEATPAPASSFTFLPNPDDRGASRRPGRRRFLTTSGIAVVTAAAGAVVGRELITRHNVSAARAALRFPRPTVAAPPLPPGVNLNIPGLSSFITPNGSFYRVDTALLLPEVDPATWHLRIHGMVQREVSITFDQLLRRPLIEDYITLTCVSDPVGGPYVGNARWLGASLADLIRQARPLAGADQLLCTSVDGFTSGTPLQIVLDGRDALLTVAMNGQALPVAHGFPARMVVPGLYGYVSACKWVTDIEVTTFASAYAYWATRGWSQQGPIKTESRIDVPVTNSTIVPGRTPVAGVAWAQHKGVAAVEVRVDAGPWQQARLAAVPDIDTWRQWVWDWDATPGTHVLEARATDATGYTQTASQAQPPPNGASGYPSATVVVHSS
ncbi:MAG TPA: molybdopterin-dependent oxidoreductase [Streptosporangiaceae bacterium]|nr:molybdopterin-dependent oxidoreductase [Streptosporangiaceae bacterium]